MLFGLAAIGSICLTASLFVPDGMPSRSAVGSRVRGATPAVNTMLASGIRRSSTLARLVRDIDDTDLIVYVEMISTMPAGLDGRLTFLTSAGGIRYLRVQVPTSLGKNDLLAVIGHELQHALEVAESPSVVSSQDLAVLYRRIGVQGMSTDRFDTAAARSIGQRVRAELLN
jgi:hypothetical protein